MKKDDEKKEEKVEEKTEASPKAVLKLGEEIGESVDHTEVKTTEKEKLKLKVKPGKCGMMLNNAGCCRLFSQFGLSLITLAWEANQNIGFVTTHISVRFICWIIMNVIFALTFAVLYDPQMKQTLTNCG